MSNDDVDTRILLSKCQQNTFQPDLAYENQLIAKNKSSNLSISVLENVASILLDKENLEISLITYLKGFKKRKHPQDFIFGIIEVVTIFFTFYIIYYTCTINTNTFH